MKTKSGTMQARRKTRPIEDAFDEADWVDWDHWQTVEEMQDFLNGVHDAPENAEPFDMADGAGQVARQIRRYGLQVDG